MRESDTRTHFEDSVLLGIEGLGCEPFNELDNSSHPWSNDDWVKLFVIKVALQGSLC